MITIFITTILIISIGILLAEPKKERKYQVLTKEQIKKLKQIRKNKYDWEL